MKTHISISESEWVVMKVLWDDSPKALPDILGSLKHTAWSTTTIQTYLARLVKKGALTTQRQGKGYLYYPTISESDCQLTESKSFLDRIYNGSLSQMVMGFVKSGKLSAQELEALKKIIQEQHLPGQCTDSYPDAQAARHESPAMYTDGEMQNTNQEEDNADHR